MSERRRAVLVDAFAEEPLAGTPVGVVPDADGLSEAQMGAIAREFDAAETAFVRDADAADRRIRYFTAETEVAHSGRATIAVHSHLYSADAIETGTHSLETGSGVVAIDVDGDGTVWTTAGAATVGHVSVDSDRIAAALGIDSAAIVDDLPIARASVGVPYLIVPVTFLANLGDADPEVAAIEELEAAYEVAGVYAFTFDTLDGDSTLHARTFGSENGVREALLGVPASGAVGGYLQTADAFDEVPDEMIVEGGHYVDRPGRVRLRVGAEISVGGSAVVALDGDIRVPEDDDDEEIIEA